MTEVLYGDPLGWSLGRSSAVTVGVFDGVHLGHREILNDLRIRGSASGWASVALIFDPHPLEVLVGEGAPKLLTGLEHRIELLEEAGAEVIGVLPFRQIRDLPANVFARDVLCQNLGARLVVVGRGFRFGSGRSGDVETLRMVGAHCGYSLDVVDLVSESGGQVISSSRVRALISDGDVVHASRLLGRPFEMRGMVVEGDGRGTEIGYPTANVRVQPRLLVPRDGVYVVRAMVDGHVYRSVLNIGVRPTFGGQERTIEAHLLDFEGDLMEKEIRLSFLGRLRDEKEFGGTDELVAQIAKDVEAARGFFE